MATILPFRALRPRPELASQVAAPPYDVVSLEEARQLAEEAAAQQAASQAAAAQ